MKSAKKCVLASLLFLSFSESIFAAESNSTGIKQQELNKLGQSEAKDNSAYKNFAVKDDQLKQIKPDYDKTDLTSTYNSMQAPTAQGSAKKWQCMSFSDANLQQLYKSQIPTERQLALDCDAIRAAEKTNDKMQGQYGDPLENELVKLFTERQNDHIKNSGTGNVNIECSPLAGAGGPETEQKCLVQMLPVEKTCNRELKVVCYNKETGKLLDGTEKCSTETLPAKPVSAMGQFTATRSGASQNVYLNDYTTGAASGQGQPYTNSVYLSGGGRSYSPDERAWMNMTITLDLDIQKKPFIKAIIGNKASNAGEIRDPIVRINGHEINTLSINYRDNDGNNMIGTQYFRNGQNTIEFSLRLYGGGNRGNNVRMNQGLVVGFKNQCFEAVCNENWNEACVQGDVMTGDDDTDIIEDD